MYQQNQRLVYYRDLNNIVHWEHETQQPDYFNSSYTLFDNKEGETAVLVLPVDEYPLNISKVSGYDLALSKSTLVVRCDLDSTHKYVRWYFDWAFKVSDLLRITSDVPQAFQVRMEVIWFSEQIETGPDSGTVDKIDFGPLVIDVLESGLQRCVTATTGTATAWRYHALIRVSADVLRRFSVGHLVAHFRQTGYVSNYSLGYQASLIIFGQTFTIDAFVGEGSRGNSVASSFECVSE